MSHTKSKARKQTSNKKTPSETSQPVTSQLAKADKSSAGDGMGSLTRFAGPARILAIAIIVVLGFWVRIEDLNHWSREPHRAFFQDQPLLTALDGYFYLNLARDLMDGKYARIDDRRSVPDYPERPYPPPLISVLTAGIAKVAHLSLNWVAALLPAFFGILIVVPLYALGYFYGGTWCAMAAVSVGILFPYNVYRSSLGWFDTDCLNVTLTASCAFFFLKFGVVQNTQRYLYAVLGLLTYLVFLWWWDQTPQAVTVVALAPLGVAILFYYRPSGRERWIFWSTVGLIVSILLVWKGFSLFLQFLQTVRSQLGYVVKESGGPFPNIGVSISEQYKPSLENIFSLSTGNIVSFVPAVVGFFLLLYRRFKASLFLVSFMALSFLAFFYARRFAIFTVLPAALGFGYLIHLMWNSRNRFRALYFIVPLLWAGIVSSLLLVNSTQIGWPKENPSLVAGMFESSQKTPQDAVIWAWWDHGYGINYWGNRATINDGSVHSGERTVYNALPMAVSSQRLAANLIHFFTSRGISGVHRVYRVVGNDEAKGFSLIKEILEEGPANARKILSKDPFVSQDEFKTVDDWLAFFFPPNPRPVYLFLDQLLTQTSYWWYWFGTWDVDSREGIHTDYRVFDQLFASGNRVRGRSGFDVDLERGVVMLGNRPVPLGKAAIWYGTKSRNFIFGDETTNFEMSFPDRFGALMLEDIAESVFNQLFLRKTYSPDYFRPVVLQSPIYQLWEVRGDSANSSQ